MASQVTDAKTISVQQLLGYVEQGYMFRERESDLLIASAMQTRFARLILRIVYHRQAPSIMFQVGLAF
jgi:hypothetical protein